MRDSIFEAVDVSCVRRTNLCLSINYIYVERKRKTERERERVLVELQGGDLVTIQRLSPKFEPGSSVT